MRQVVGFLQVIHKADLVSFYSSLSSYGLIHGAKLPSLDEFLNQSLNGESHTAFDEKTDKLLEEHARKLVEGKRKNVQ